MHVDSMFDAIGPADTPPLVRIHGSVVPRKIWLPPLRGLADACRIMVSVRDAVRLSFRFNTGGKDLLRARA